MSFGDYYRKLYSTIFLGRLVTVMYSLVLFFLERNEYFLTVTFFSLCYVGINYGNATPFLYRILSFQNI